MKKLLSGIIAISLLISMLPLSFAADAKAVVYTLGYATEDTKGYINLAREESGDKGKVEGRNYIERKIGENTRYLDELYFTYAERSGGKWKILDVSDDIIEGAAVTANRRMRIHAEQYFQLHMNWSDAQKDVDDNIVSPLNIALALKAPEEKGFYAVTIKNPDNFKIYPTGLYLDKFSDEKTEVAQYTIEKNRAETTTDSDAYTLSSDEVIYSNSSDEIVIAITGETKQYQFESITLTPVDVSTVSLNVASSIEVGETTSAKVAAGEKSVVDSFVTYSVTEGSDVIDIAADGTITAKAAGTATIKATVGELSDSETITVTEPASVDAPTTISYGVFVNVKDCATDVTANNAVLDSTTGSKTGELEVGNTLTATAKDELSGYTFRYWVLGSAETGRYYSSEKTVAVKPYANIALTAIYTPKETETETIIDLFNWNGEYLKTLKASELASLSDIQPTMIGYTFANKWLFPDGKTELTEDSEITGNTKAVAQFTAAGSYDKAVSQEETSSTGWTRNGKLVTYSSDYTFYTWLNDVGTIAANTEAVTDKIPLAVLESNGNNYMLEYDEGEYEVVEAGILFGSTDSVDVKSAYSKAKVKNLAENDGHGQMTATSMGTANESYARGYVMYIDKNDNNKIKVVYSK